MPEDDSSSADSNDDEQTQSSSANQQEEQLVTRLQLRLAASHLPKTSAGGGRLKRFSRRSPDTFATVTSIVDGSHHQGQGVAPHICYRHTDILQQTSGSSFLDKEKSMVEWGCTEVIKHSTSPQWVTTIPLEYEYGANLHFYVRVLLAGGHSESKHSSKGSDFSIGSNVSNCSGGTPLDVTEKNRTGFCFGSALFEVGDILGSRNFTKVKRLKGGGCVYARIEPVKEKKEEQKTRFRFQFQAFDLAIKKRSRLSIGAAEPDTVVEIARKHDSPSVQSWVTVFRSNPVLGSFNPCWDVAEIDLEACCRNEDLGQHIQLSVYRVKEGHKRKQIGMCETTMQNILANAHNNLQQGQVDEIVVSEKDFLLQRNIQRLQEVGKLSVRQAYLISSAGEELPTTYNLLSQSPSTISTTSTSPSSSSPSTSTNGLDYDPLNVDLRQMPVLSSAPAVSLNEFIDCGGQLEFCVAIDFTSSNGK